MKYTIETFNRQFPTEEACLEYLLIAQKRSKKGYVKVKNRRAYADKKGKQYYPTAGTIFHGSSTSLVLWFYAIYLFSVSKHGVSAKELQRVLGTTYKCAWRIGNRIRNKMKEDTGLFKGVVEFDEAFIGGNRRLEVFRKGHNKNPVFGMIERGGRVHAEPVPNLSYFTLYQIFHKKLHRGARIITDEARSYLPLKHDGYKHKSVNHSKWEYVRYEKNLTVTTNTIEAFWSHLKNGINGTYRYVSKQHLASYVFESSFRHNHRHEISFPYLLSHVLKP